MAELNPAPAAAEAEDRQGGPGMLGPGHLALVVLFAGFYLLLSYLPLRAPDLWGHILYGEWILDHRSLPAEDPVVPLAEGMRVVDTVWLSQTILALVERAGGAEWLSGAFALTVLLTYLVLARVLYLATGSKLASALGMLAALALAWGRSTVFRPESFGALCFVALLWLLVTGPAAAASGEAESGERERRARRLWYRVPLLFLAWANLHGSFGFGLLVLGCLLLGRVAEVGWRTRSVRAVAADRKARRWLYLSELAAAATLVNPYGIDLWLYLLRFGDGASLAVLPELQPLTFRGLPGLAFALSWLLLFLVARHGRRPLPAAHVLLVAAFGAGVLAGVGRLAWYGPVWALVAMPHLGELASRLRRRREGGGPGFAIGPSWRFSVLSAMVVFTACTLSPAGAPLVGREPRSRAQVLGRETPLAVAGFLAANPPPGPIFHPEHWGDWLAFEGAGRLKPFVTSSSMHRLPGRVWQAFSRILWAGYEWEVILGRHTIETVVLDKLQDQRLLRAMSLADGWGLAYDDGTAAVFVQTPNGARAQGGAPEGAAPDGGFPEPGGPAVDLGGRDGAGAGGR